MKNHIWTDIEALSTNGSIAPEQVFEKARHDLEHAELIKSMLSTSTREITCEGTTAKKCEDSVEFRRVSSFFQNNAERFLRESPVYKYNFEELIPELSEALGRGKQPSTFSKLCMKIQHQLL